MSTITTHDGTEIYYKDWGEGTPIVFAHGWPLTADAWDAQMLFFVNEGYRVIAHDRRGHGRSEQSSDGNTMDQYADDLAELFAALDLQEAILIGHSTGGGEVARYIGRHGTDRLAKAVLISAVPPTMLKTEANPDGLPIDVFDGLRTGMIEDRAQFYLELAQPFFGYNREGAKASQGVIDQFWLQSIAGSIWGAYECIKQFSETDFTADLEKFDVPTLILHGDDDQIVPIADAALKSVEIVSDATLKVYEGAPHGMCVTRAAEINADLLAFVKGS
ncbi:MAG: alpha/beta hydrolase fold protein [Conexibacter sp.]|nr:alpha/beta hydrolase fold protein [Conexibacter sp.]